MADDKSCEGKVTTLQCMVCNFKEVFTERQFRNVDGLSCLVCNGPVMPVVTKSGEAIINRKTLSKKGKSNLTMRMDFSGSIKQLKAIQREAKKATVALKRLDHVKKHTCPNCGKISLKITGLHADGGCCKEIKECNDCGWYHEFEK